MSKLAGLIQILGAGYAGYLKGQKAEEDRTQDKADKQADRDYLKEQRAYETEQRNKAQKLETDLAASQEDQNVEDIPSYDLGSMSGGDPSGAPVVGYRLGNQTFGDRGAANVASLGVNSRASKDQRAAGVMRQAGQIDKARQFDDFAQKAINEGSDQVLSAITASAPTVDAVKKAGGLVAGTVGQQAADVFNKTGGRWKVTPDTTVQHYIDKDPNGREFVNSRVLGKDGKPVVDDVYHSGLMLADFKTRLEQRNAEVRAAQTAEQQAEAARHNKASETEIRRNNVAQNGTAAAQVGVLQAREKREAASFKAQSPEGQLEQLELAVGPLSPEDKKAYRKKLLGIGSNKGSDEALVGDLTKKWSENNPQATPQDVAKYRDGLATSFQQVGNNKAVESSLKAEFSKHAPGTPGYLQTWNDAKADLGMTDAQLTVLGYKPPAAPGRQPRAAAAVGTAMPTADDNMRAWVKDKLLGPLDGPGKYAEIAKTHPNPAVRRAAQQLADEYVGQQQQANDTFAGQ